MPAPSGGIFFRSRAAFTNEIFVSDHGLDPPALPGISMMKGWSLTVNVSESMLRWVLIGVDPIVGS